MNWKVALVGLVDARPLRRTAATKLFCVMARGIYRGRPILGRAVVCIFQPTVGQKSHSLGVRDPLAAEHRRTWEEPLVAGDFVVVIIEKVEISFPQLEYRDIRGRTDIERAAVVEQREDARSIYGSSCDRLIERHAVTKQL